MCEATVCADIVILWWGGLAALLAVLGFLLVYWVAKFIRSLFF